MYMLIISKSFMKKISLLFISVISLVFSAKAQLTVEIVTPEEAVQLLVGPDLVVSNISYTGDPLQLGYYQNATGSFPIPAGIILSTDGAQDIVLNNTPALLTSSVTGEQDLLDIANAVPPLIGQTFTVGSVNDVAILEFDFVATGPDLAFNYVFGSDEYLEWVNSTFNDVFAFLISGPGITGDYASPAGFPDGAMMISGVANTNPFLPITVSSVNDQLNSDYYIDNVNNNDIALDGYTVTLQATATLNCGETYHMKLAIADGSDGSLKSIVGFQEGSFNVQGSFIEAIVSNPLAPLGETTLVEGCLDGQLILYPPACAAATLPVELVYGGTAVNGVDYEAMPSSVTIQGTELIIPITVIPDLLNDEGFETLTIEMFFTNIEGEPDSVSTAIDIFDYVQPTVNVGNIYICNESVTVTPEVENGLGPYTYAWSVGSTSNTTTYVEGDAGDYSINVTDFCGTTFSDEFQVIEPEPLEVVEFLNNCYGVPTGDLASGGALPYDVIYAEDSLNRNEYSFTSIYAGLYTIIFTDQCGSTGTSTVRTEICETRFPNIFTPDGDGKNDTFEIFGVEGFKGSRLQIFDRWGNMILDDEDYRNDWDGKGLPDGVYYYVFTRSDGKVNKAGNFQKLGSK